MADAVIMHAPRPEDDIMDVWSSDDDYISSEEDQEISLSLINNSRTIPLSLRANYTNWSPREAFRELIQNWRDAIIVSFGLEEREFEVERDERTTGRNAEIVYRVRRPRSEPAEWLGYVRFKARDGLGTIEITNRKAILLPKHLDLGGTSKTYDERQAGTHGEGLKLAINILMRGRENHAVRFRAGRFTWTFSFTKIGRLACTLRRIPPERIHSMEQQAQRQCARSLLPFAARPDKDVQLMVGERLRGRDGSGRKVTRELVHRTDFENWISCALFLQNIPEDGCVRTDHGDLLTNQRVKGNIYLKGLLLQESNPSRSASITGKPLKFGYNFASGMVNRERQSVRGAAEEARIIMDVWNKVLILQPDRVSDLSDMLNSKETEYADVVGAKFHIDARTARQLRSHLFSAPFQDIWYYSGEEQSKNPRLDSIIQGLGRRGEELTQPYWAVLHKHGFIRTAEVEEEQRINESEPTEGPQTVFAASVSRILRAAMKACPLTNQSSVCFVKAGQLQLQLLYSHAENLFRVHERWLDEKSVIDELGLDEGVRASDVLFHAVKRLFSDALRQLPLASNNDMDSRRQIKLETSRTEQRLLDYLRISSLHILPSEPSSSIGLHWHVDSGWKQDTEVEIQFHSYPGCLHGMNSALLAQQVALLNLACIAGGDQTEHLNDTVCFRTPRIPVLDGRYVESHLRQGHRYLVVFCVPSEPLSFVVRTGHYHTMRAPVLPLPPPLPRANGSMSRIRAPLDSSVSQFQGSVGNTSEPMAISSDESNDETGGIGDHPGEQGQQDPSSPESLRLSPTNDTPTVFRESQTASRASGHTAARDSSTSFSLGQQLRTVDIMAVRRWHRGVNPGGVGAFIGLLADCDESPNESRKRPRSGPE